MALVKLWDDDDVTGDGLHAIERFRHRALQYLSVGENVGYRDGTNDGRTVGLPVACSLRCPLSSLHSTCTFDVPSTVYK